MMMATTIPIDYDALIGRVPTVKFAELDVVEPLGLVGAIIDALGREGRGLPVCDVWRHSLAVGIAARRLAQVCGVQGVASEVYFVSGALHDLGRVMLMREFPEQYSKAIEEAVIGERESTEIERQEFNFDHAQLGADIARTWGLGSELCDLIEYHHDANLSRDSEGIQTLLVVSGGGEGALRLPRLVRVADQCVKAMGVGYDADGCHGIEGAWLADEKMKVGDLPGLLVGLEEEAEDLAALLGV